MNKKVKVTVNKREVMIFDDMNQANQFINSFTADFAENIIIAAPKETHKNLVEMSAIFYNPYQEKPEGQEVVLLDILMPK
jgi:histidinol dehydrogenase